MILKELAVVLTRNEEQEGTVGRGTENIIAEVLASSLFKEVEYFVLSDKNGVNGLDELYFPAGHGEHLGITSIGLWYMGLNELEASWNTLTEKIGGTAVEQTLKVTLTEKQAMRLNSEERIKINRKLYGVDFFKAGNILNIMCETYRYALPPYFEQDNKAESADGWEEIDTDEPVETAEPTNDETADILKAIEESGEETAEGVEKADTVVTAEEETITGDVVATSLIVCIPVLVKGVDVSGNQ